MLNLLPKDQKKKLIREYRIRFWVVAFALALAGEVISLILLLPPYLTAETRISILDAQSASFKAQNVTTEIASLTDTVKQANVYLNALNSSSTPTGIAEAIKNVLDVRGSAIKVSDVLYRAVNGQQQITVNGLAGSRQALLDFAKKIKSQSNVVSADLPVSNFAQSQDIAFSLTVVINPPKP